MRYRTKPASTAEVEQRYRLEDELMRLVSQGDAESVHELLARLATWSVMDRAPGNELRSQKNALIVLNTLCRKAIERGGVHPLHIHNVSQRSAVAIERARTIESLVQREHEMIDDYCALSRQGAGRGYSLLISRCIEYVKLKHVRRITSAELVALVRVSSSYLCRKFKTETGMTVVQFVNHTRVEEAKRLLVSSLRPLSAIAADVGFESESYFSRVFRKLSGMTPTEYRNSSRGRAAARLAGGKNMRPP